ncbi:MAG: HisA/HisF-related TIM barrel protein [Caldilineaceae bacterium]
MMRFRPCIDLKDGQVVQIVGGSLRDDDQQATLTNFATDRAPADFARLYQADGLVGGHVIALGPGNQTAALAALQAFPGGLQIGGGITPANARLSGCRCKSCDCHLLCFSPGTSGLGAFGRVGGRCGQRTSGARSQLQAT